ncbi:alpha/beta hydrolase [Tessaracoccus sp. MC1627]|uniref:alpha/beta fold hydrolase n=1 Tax=Tessaracoccus sp. MC1627 TaxID=2760312 RepID=UPI001600A85D|nr:alpha/beta hydrolase [Tessaracoccus sp. MC1627]MBB1514038.1 alpha/beta hydrolase [Tessaracoccus sp. MC1627]
MVTSDVPTGLVADWRAMRTVARVAGAFTAVAMIVLAGCSAQGSPSGSAGSPPQAPPQSSAGSTIAGVTEDAATTGAANEASLPKPPGQLVDVDGYLMHLYCLGEGGPTVLLEAGLGDISLMYRPLQEELAATTRVCAYDRAGLGWSEPRGTPRTGEQMVAELKMLLEEAGETGPYVLAGHSLGGLIMLLFAEANPERVSGVVLIDSAHPRQDEAFAEFTWREVLDQESLAWMETMATSVAAGAIEPEEMARLAPRHFLLELRQQWTALYLEPHSHRTILEEAQAFPQTLNQVGGEGSLGDIPLVVVAAGHALEKGMSGVDRQRFLITPDIVERYDSLWVELQTEHLNRSTNARLVVAENSAHYIYFDEPDVVIKAIRDLVAIQ